MSINVLIMAGGNGTRFWPVSTPKSPKQYINLIGEDSLIQSSLKRSLKFAEAKDSYVVTVKAQAEIAKKHTEDLIPEGNLIFEPEGRNTAPCIFLSLLTLLKNGHSPDECVAVLPSEHVILDVNSFKNDLLLAKDESLKNQKITTRKLVLDFCYK